MMPRQSYYDLASELAEVAPSQARLLRHLLIQSEMQEMEQICDSLDLSVGAFRNLVSKLRDRGIEVVSKRVHAPGDPAADVRYVYGVVTNEVENWSSDRRKAVLTAWDRTTKVFERHLFGLDLPHSEIYKILGVMEYVTKTLKDIDLDVSLRTEEKIAEVAKEQTTAVELNV